MHRAIVFVLAAVLFPFLSSAAGSPSAPGTYQCEGGYFRAQVPAAWTRADRTPPYADMTTVSGAQFVGPGHADAVAATISLYYYHGDRNFMDPESYINARFGSMVQVEPERGRETSSLQVAGRSATGFHLKTFELVARPPEHPVAGRDGDPKVYEMAPLTTKVVMDEYAIVVPASTGYFVLQYRAPAQTASAHRPVFDRVVATFEPHVP